MRVHIKSIFSPTHRSNRVEDKQDGTSSHAIRSHACFIESCDRAKKILN